MRKIISAQLHQAGHVPGFGPVPNRLPPEKTVDGPYEMHEAMAGIQLDFKWHGIAYSVVVPWANVINARYENEAPKPAKAKSAKDSDQQ